MREIYTSGGAHEGRQIWVEQLSATDASWKMDCLMGADGGELAVIHDHNQHGRAVLDGCGNLHQSA